MEFVIGGMAASCAGFFTNPLEVLKIRMQLQGELKKKGHHVVHYKNVFHAAYQVAKYDGIVALQTGLAPALWIQFIMNGLRFGTYQFADNRGYIKDQNGKIIFHRNLMISGAGGVVGHYLSNPLHVVKTQLQSKAVEAIAVGHQHSHKGTLSGLTEIFKDEGVKGLFRGGWAVLPRAFVASASQLTAFFYSKQFLAKFPFFDDKQLLKSFTASMIGGIAISVMVTPFDLILIRLYNQPIDESGKGKLYHGYFDCVRKIYKMEGISAFYKGVGPMYLRLGPHTVLCLVFWDKFKEWYDQINEKKHIKN